MPETAKKKKADSLSYEQAIEELEELVQKLETGNLTLEESVQLYEQGVELSALCRQKLEDAELKIKTIQSGKEK